MYCFFRTFLGFEKILLFNIHTHSTNLQITVVRKIDHTHRGDSWDWFLLSSRELTTTVQLAFWGYGRGVDIRRWVTGAAPRPRNPTIAAL